MPPHHLRDMAVVHRNMSETEEPPHTQHHENRMNVIGVGRTDGEGREVVGQGGQKRQERNEGNNYKPASRQVKGTQAARSSPATHSHATRVAVRKAQQRTVMSQAALSQTNGRHNASVVRWWW